MRKVIIDYSSVTTVGLDLAKHVFFVHAIDGVGRVVMAKAFAARTCWGSSWGCHIVGSAWKPAVQPTIGHGNSSNLAMTFG